MSIMIPISPLDFNSSEGEVEVFNALKQLGDQCYVFHSVRWLSSLNYKGVQGEADFLIFDIKKGLLVIEVKSGIVRCHERQWFQKNRSTGVEKEIADPEAQASRSKFFLIEKIRNQLNSSEFCLVGHAVWFPSGVFPKESLPLNYPKEILLDAESLTQPNAAISRVYSYWSNKVTKTSLAKASIEKIINIIAPTFSVIPSLRYAYETREKQFIKMTAEQARIIEFLDEQKKAVISGSAGTGKTVVALEKARRLSESGHKVLFLCFNRALRNFLHQNHNLSGVDFQTFHSLARKYIEIEKISYDERVSLFLDYLSKDDSKWDYEHLIIDEGQDFDSDWIDWLDYKTVGCSYVFFDRNQLIQKDRVPDWIDRAECRLVLSRNCRNTLQIARTSHRCTNLEIKGGEQLIKGQNTQLYDCNNELDITKNNINLIVKNLLDNAGIKPHNIAILTMETEDESLLNGIKKISGISLSRNFELNSLCFTSVRKFKGLEAKVVILVDVFPEKFLDDEWKRRLYVGCSRAVHELHIMFQQLSEDSIKAAIEGIAPGGKMLRNRKSLATLLDAHWFKGVKNV